MVRITTGVSDGTVTSQVFGDSGWAGVVSVVVAGYAAVDAAAVGAKSLICVAVHLHLSVLRYVHSGERRVEEFLGNLDLHRFEQRALAVEEHVEKEVLLWNVPRVGHSAFLELDVFLRVAVAAVAMVEMLRLARAGGVCHRLASSLALCVRRRPSDGSDASDTVGGGGCSCGCFSHGLSCKHRLWVFRCGILGCPAAVKENSFKGLEKKEKPDGREERKKRTSKKGVVEINTSRSLPSRIL